MTTDNTSRKKWPVKRTIAVAVLLILTTAGIALYNNFNKLLSTALMNSFNSSNVSDVYELKFENLHVSLLDGSIKVINVSVLPREKPLRVYPYINSSFRFKTEKLSLENVELFKLLKSNQLKLKSVFILKPEVELTLAGERNIFLPFNDSAAAVVDSKEANNKKSLGAFNLNEFQLADAHVHVTNAGKQREMKIEDFNISLNNFQVEPRKGEFLTTIKQVTVSLGKFTGYLQKGGIRHIGFNDFKIGVDSLALEYTLDTVMYQFKNFNAGLNKLDIQTKDSIFHLAMQSFGLSYKDKSIKIKGVSFKPNVNHAAIQKDYKYWHTEFSGAVGTLELNKVNFDSLIYAQKIFVDEVILDSVIASIYKDKTKPMDKNRFPVYLGQTISDIPLPVHVKLVKATHVNLDNTERKEDGNLAKVNITRGTVEVKNITNLSPNAKLIMNADAYINDKAHFKASLTFDYQKPQFGFEALIYKFNLPDLNPLIQAYTPAKINKGVADKITFSGIAEKTKSNGTMSFLYHDLEIDLELKEKAKWKSSVIALTGNAALNNSNPPSADMPPRIVQFQVERDMNKGFINVLIKSILVGLKETMIMNKENRKAYKEHKKAHKESKKKSEK
ncbi:MAG: hypothetical protein ABI723_02770 [Bacteroidia bacterium]